MNHPKPLRPMQSRFILALAMILLASALGGGFSSRESNGHQATEDFLSCLISPFPIQAEELQSDEEANAEKGITFQDTPQESQGYWEKTFQNDLKVDLLGGEQQTPESLAQAICTGINEPNSLGTLYGALSNSVRSQLTEDQFRRYVQAICPRPNVHIQYFQRLTSKEAAELIELIAKYAPGLAEESQKTVFFQAVWTEENELADPDEAHNQVIIAVQRSKSGEAYLNPQWVKSVIYLRDWSRLYFEAIEQDGMGQKDMRPLEALMKPQIAGHFLDPEEGETFLASKSDAIVSFYSRVVSTLPTASVCSLILPGVARFQQNYAHGGGLSGRRVVQIQGSEGLVTVSEPIPNRLDRPAIQLLIYGEPLFQTLRQYSGARFSQEDIHPLAGHVLSLEPLQEVADNPMAGTEENPAEISPISRYKINYYGFSLVIDQASDVDMAKGNWEGVIQSISVSTKIISLGGSLRTGQTELAWREQLPFYEEQDRRVSFASEPLKTGRLDFQMSGKVVTGWSVFR